MKGKILVVDDEPDIREIITLCLRREMYDVVEAGSAEEALRALDPAFSLILLDVLMDGMNGFDMARKLRAEGNTIPIIFLTAKDTERDMLEGFGAGADDYIRKPFSAKELTARVKSLITRSTRPAAPAGDILQAGPLTLNIASKSVLVDRLPVSLTRTEYDILLLLVKNQGLTLPRTAIMDAVWKDDKAVMERTVDVHIARLRHKLGKHSGLIANRVGFGYTFRLPLRDPDQNPK